MAVPDGFLGGGAQPEEPRQHFLKAVNGYAAPEAKSPSASTARDDYASLRQEKIELRDAEGLLERERARIRGVESIPVCKKLRPTYDALCQRIVDAAALLKSAIEEHEQLLIDCDGAEVSPGALDVLPVGIQRRILAPLGDLLVQAEERGTKPSREARR